MRLAALVSFALLAIPDGQTQPHKLMGDELYAAYLKRGPAILTGAFPSGTRWPDFLKDFQSRVLPRWHKEECVPSRAMFLFDMSLARPTRNLALASAAFWGGVLLIDCASEGCSGDAKAALTVIGVASTGGAAAVGAMINAATRNGRRIYRR